MGSALLVKLWMIIVLHAPVQQHAQAAPILNIFSVHLVLMVVLMAHIPTEASAIVMNELFVKKTKMK